MNRIAKSSPPLSEVIKTEKIFLAEGDIGASPHLSGFTSFSNSFEIEGPTSPLNFEF